MPNITGITFTPASLTLAGAGMSGGPTAALNQRIQEMTFNLQQIQ
jgi:hypothetical protein